MQMKKQCIWKGCSESDLFVRKAMSLYSKYHSLQLEKPCIGGRKKITGKMSEEKQLFSVTAVIKTQ